MFWTEKSKKTRTFNGWVDSYSSNLYKTALWMLGESSTAEDVVQDTFVMAWDSFDQLASQEKVLSWLLTILRRRVYKEYAFRETTFSAESPIEFAGEVGKEEQPGEDIDLMAALQSLPLDQRDCFLLSSLHGFTYQEIAEQLAVPTGTVMSRISRAKQKLKYLLGEADQPTNKVLSLQIQSKQEVS